MNLFVLGSGAFGFFAPSEVEAALPTGGQVTIYALSEIDLFFRLMGITKITESLKRL